MRFVLAFLTTIFALTRVFGQDNTAVLKSDGQLQLGRTAWTYRPGDNLDWAEPDYDDSSWEVRTDTWYEPGDMPRSGWTGVGWFRLRFTADSSAVGETLAFTLYMRGAADVFLDGKRIATYGRVGKSREDEVSVVHMGPNPPLTFLRLSDPGPHVLAVRHSNFRAADFHKVGGPIGGFEIWMGVPQVMTEKVRNDLVEFVSTQFFFTGIPLGFALLYLVLFAFHPGERNYLYFGILCASVAAMTFIDLESEQLVDTEQFRLQRKLLMIVGVVMVLTLLRFVYGLFYDRVPKHFYYVLAAGALLGIWSWVSPFDAWAAHNVAGLAVIVEVARVTAVALWRGRPDAWLIGLGLLFFLIGTSYDLAMDMGWISAVGDVTNGYYYGFVALLAPMAVYLARDVARGHALESEHARQREELEAARKLQLSMLPRTIPKHPSVDVAAHMQTATEVGGDYYDFDLSDNGTLTIALGDATGHGLRAGTMVTATKSLFSFLLEEPSLEKALARSSDALRRLGMNQLYMALAVARLEDGELQVAGAGMPPALWYRSVDRSLEPVPLKGLPLGSPSVFPYQSKKLRLEPGDSIVFMSDGFPELRGLDGQMLGDERVRVAFQTVADRSAQEIVDYLASYCNEWTQGRPLSDDVTFVAMRVLS